MLKKVLISVLLFVLLITPHIVVNAGFLGNVIGQGTNFVKGHNTEAIGTAIRKIIMNDIKPAVFSIGTLIFAAVTVILGVKFIWSSAEGKSEVQEALPGFVLAVILFYLAEPVVNFLLGSTSSITGVSSINAMVSQKGNGATSWTAIAGATIKLINYVVKYLALAGLVYLGIRYMIASAEGKASMKVSMAGAVIGVLFTFLATNVVQFIIDTGESIL
ncbi:MAG: hypothetical protein IKL68_05925 [Clostridia bacterium]|nr:hypothetical protein [Clostridia bacterium]